MEIHGEKKWVCECGLTKNPPWCDGSHKNTKDEEEDKVYMYCDGKRKEVKNI